MKKLASIVALMALTFSFAFAQDTTPVTTNAASEAKEGGPILVFETTEVDYGVIEQGSDPIRVFNFTNTGDEALVISNAKGSCGCTVPKYPKTPIEPGQNAVIEVRYDTKRLGKFTKTVRLTTNEAGEAPQHIIRISGEVLKKDEEPAGVPASAGGFGN